MVTTPSIWSILVKFLKLLYVTHNLRITMLDLQLQLHPWVRKVWKKPSTVRLTRQAFIRWVDLYCFLKTRNAQVNCAEKPQMKKKQFKEIKTLISNSFQGKNWKSDIAMFEWRDTLNYGNSPFNASELLLKLERMKMEKLINTFITRVKPIQNYWSRNCSCSHCCIIPGFFLTKKEGERMIKL